VLPSCDSNDCSGDSQPLWVLPGWHHWSSLRFTTANHVLCAAAQMLAKRQAMGDQEPPARATKRARDIDSDDDDDDDDDAEGGGRGERDTDQRRRKAKEGGSKTAAVKPSKQVPIAGSCSLCAVLQRPQWHGASGSRLMRPR